MDRRGFIKLGMAILATIAAPPFIAVKGKSLPVVYYMDCAIIDLSFNRIIFWGDKLEKNAFVKITHVLSLVSNDYEGMMNKEITKATGLKEFKLVRIEPNSPLNINVSEEIENQARKLLEKFKEPKKVLISRNLYEPWRDSFYPMSNGTPQCSSSIQIEQFTTCAGTLDIEVVEVFNVLKVTT